MRKFYLVLGAILFLSSFLQIGFCSSEEQTIPIKRDFSIKISQPGQSRQFLVPEKPLAFDTTLDWQLTINKKSLASEKAPAFMMIQPVNYNEKQVLKYLNTQTGSIQIPKGTQYQITIGAGEYSFLFSPAGAEVTLKLTYNEALIKYYQADKPFTFNFEIVGPACFTEWKWDWTNGQNSKGADVSHTFSGAGLNSVLVEGYGAPDSKGGSPGKFHFELDVPPVIVLNPTVEPLRGPVELNVKVQANAIINYGQKATLSWDFGNGLELTGAEAGNVYMMPGKYKLILTANAGDYSIQRNWVVEVDPISIFPNPTVTPLTGPVPLNIKGMVNPVITGGPTQVVYTWTMNEQSVEGIEYQQSLTEPGDYILVLKTVDELHPQVVIPDSVFLVKALPPELNLKPLVSKEEGTIPLQVDFQPNLEVKGTPVDLSYWWDFGDGNTSTSEKPSHTYQKAGEYLVQLTVTDRLHPGNMVMASVKIKALPPELNPTATANETTGLIPFKVKFNGETAITSGLCEPQYFWDFGDGSTSLEQNPIHTYLSEGTYTVTLTVKDRLNPANSGQTSLKITPKNPKLKLTVALSPTSGPVPLTIKGQAFAEKEGGDNKNLKIEWAFDDGRKATGEEITHTFVNPGTYNVLITVTDLELGIQEKKTVKVSVKSK